MEKNLCECGCGQEVKQKNYWPYSWNTFVQGHNTRCFSKELREQITKSHIGGKRSKEVKQKMSQAQTGRKQSKETKEKLRKINLGHKVSKEVREKISKAQKGKKVTKETVLKRYITMLEKRQKSGLVDKDTYCDVWRDSNYLKDIRKFSCEKCGITNMMNIHLCGRKLSLHHKSGNKKCSPNDIQTLCNSCHAKLHHKLRRKLKNV